MWWISYRGESGHGVGSNIGVFEDDGSPRKSIRCSSIHPRTRIRSISRAASHWWATTSTSRTRGSRDSHIARYQRHGETFYFMEVLAKTAQVAAMVHPFDVELGDDGRVYISCQDTNTVLALSSRRPANPRPCPLISTKQYPNGRFLPGTLVASSPGGALASTGSSRPLDVPRHSASG